MKLSEHTISVLKNYASINQNLVIKEGSELQTMSAMKKTSLQGLSRRELSKRDRRYMT